MSKKSNKKAAKKPKKVNKKAVIITAVIAAVLICAGVAVGIFAYHAGKGYRELEGSLWVPRGADNASGDEVSLNEIYNTKYDNYRGSLTFKNDKTFELWLTPGEADDGTHKGVYELTEGDEIAVLFDDGTQTSFLIHRDGAEIDNISVLYDGYTVYFIRQ